jgi:molybdopterin-guanine dinucleotide biosynthesis protein A
LEAALEAGQLGARDWMQAQGALEVDFSDCAERFANINHPQGLHGDVLA